MLRNLLMLAGSLFVLWQTAVNPQRASASVVMNYGADGNDYYQFTTPSMAFDKASGFTTLITFGIHVNADGTLMIAGAACATNGLYTGPTNWGSLVATLKTAPTTVTRYEVLIGGWQDTSYDNIKSLVALHGTGPTSILYKNFQALKNAVPGIDAINDDDEQTYDLSSSTSFANMLGSLGYKFTFVPYTAQSFWVNLKNSTTNCDYIYLQCYEGGAGNDPGQWNNAFGHGVVVIPGQESNTANPANWRSWYLETGVQGGFYYPDVVFNNTYWSAAVIEGNGAAPAVPAGLIAVPGGAQVSLSWNTAPGAISYTLKRSTSSGGETAFATISTANNWPASNQYIDSGLSPGTTYYYKMSATNTNGVSPDAAEVSATPTPTIGLDVGFETPGIGAGNYAYNPAGSPWTFSGASPNGSGIVANGSGFSNPNALEGSQAAFVQEYGTIKQTISGFAPGTNYTVTFYAAERPGNSQTWNVTVNGIVVGSFNPGSSASSYLTYMANFTASATTETLALVGTDLAGGDNTIFIDDVQITAIGSSLSPVLATDTLPVTAADVVGSQVTFTAAFTAGSPMVYQWRMISGGTTNNIFGETNETLIFSDLQLTNTASYQLVASNAYGVLVSTPAALTVSSVPAPVNNAIASYAAQTGFATGTSFTPTWIPAANSLIAGQIPIATNGDYNLEPFWGNRTVDSLTEGGSLTVAAGGSPTTTSTNYVTCGNGTGNNGAGTFVAAGSLVIYTLTNTFAAGCNLTNITVYGGWKDAGRDQQAYTVYYSKVTAPASFIQLCSVNYTPANAAGALCATRATLTPASGMLAADVAAVKFDFTTPTTPNGYEGYSEIDLYGAPVALQFTATPTNGLAPLTVQFNSPAVDTGGNAITSWNWNFGDGATSTQQNPPHVYDAPGSYAPSLVATNSLGYRLVGSGPSINPVFNSGLVVNGSFETGDFTGWTLFGGDPGDNYVDNEADSGIAPHSGSFLALLGSAGSLSYLSQTLATTAGTPYLLSLWLDSPDGQTPIEFLVSWNGKTRFDEMNLPALGWTNLQFLVSATGTNSLLEIGFRDDPSVLGLDDISVQAMPPGALPNFTGLSLSGSDLTFNGTNGLAGTTCEVLMSTNLTLPFNQWTPVATNVLNTSGNFTLTLTNAVNPDAPQQFYVLQWK